MDTSSNVFPLNQFVHVAATLDNDTGQRKLYINGDIVAQLTTDVRPYRDFPANSGNSGVGIGGVPASINQFPFDGLIDELSIYNRAISASEIQAIYNAGTAATGAAGKCLSTIKSRKRVRFF